MSSWETVTVKVYAEAARLAPALKITCVQPFYEDADYIEALYQVTAPYLAQPHDFILFSYHGIPVRHLRKADSSKAHCTLVKDCCNTCSSAHATCYKAQITKTTQALVERAGITADRHAISFQSRLAGEPWLTPYTDYELKRLPQEGKNRILVMTPAFVTDCLETLEEINMEGRAAFLQAGGQQFHYIPCLNDDPAWIGALCELTQTHLAGWPTQSAPDAAALAASRAAALALGARQ